jgi:hypothetical protein
VKKPPQRAAQLEWKNNEILPANLRASKMIDPRAFDVRQSGRVLMGKTTSRKADIGRNDSVCPKAEFGAIKIKGTNGKWLTN